jgi:hypothetical protein
VSDRNLVEMERAFDQLMRSTKSELMALRRTAGRSSFSRAVECAEVYFPNVVNTPAQPTDGYFVDHPMIEMDVDPGAWWVRGVLRGRQQWTGGPGLVPELGGGYARHTLRIYTRPIGTATKTLRRESLKTPLSGELPDRGVSNFGSEYVTMRCTTRLSTEIPLTISLEGRLDIEGTPPPPGGGGGAGPNEFWLGPGTLIAKPL